MENRDLILMLIDKSINSFGQVHGLTMESKQKNVLSVTQRTVKESFNIDSDTLSAKTLTSLLANGLLDLGQVHILTDLLWTQAEILLKLNQPQESLIHYKNALQLLRWQTIQIVENGSLERKNKISELEAIIAALKLRNKVCSTTDVTKN